ncbi:hypothetical protein D5R55_25030 [Burkholderia cenocepacia]|uniref:Uncharacterized protein n=1 Tax=Burkholderia cenocepacia TaxID=95486 RepID=A0A3Q9FDX3_9BURK|nr:hypothetical protein D5R55_25030 [Burkholderia cenocepacia]
MPLRTPSRAPRRRTPAFFSTQAHRLRHLRARHSADSHLQTGAAPRVIPSRGGCASQAGSLNERTT